MIKFFQCKWAKTYEKHRDEIERLGFDIWGNQPLDLMSAISDKEYFIALNEEALSLL